MIKIIDKTLKTYKNNAINNMNQDKTLKKQHTLV